MNKSIFYILLLTALPLCFTGCRKEVRPTSMTIKDSVRHYYPIKQGQQLDIMFTITNTGDAPLIISEMQPSCGCIILDKSSHIIIPEDGIRQFKATYNTINKGAGTDFIEFKARHVLVLGMDALTRTGLAGQDLLV